MNVTSAKIIGTLQTPVLPSPESPQNFELGSLVLVAFLMMSLHLSFFSRVICARCNILIAVSLLANKIRGNKLVENRFVTYMHWSCPNHKLSQFCH